MANLIPVTLPDGRVVNMLESPGLLANQGAGGVSGTGDMSDMQGVGGAGDMQGGGYGAGGAPGFGTSVASPQSGASGAASVSPAESVSWPDPVEPAKSTSSDRQSVPEYDPSMAPQPVVTPARWIPGKMREVAYTQQEGANISGERLDAIDQAYQGRIDAAQQLRDDLEIAQADQRIDESLALQERQDALAEQRERRRAIDAEIQQAKMARDDAVTKAEEAAVDPSRFYSSRPAWAKALAGIGLAIQAAAQRYVEGLQGQSAEPLRGLDIVRQAWRDDIEKQKVLYEQSKERSELANNRYAEALQLHGSPEAAEQALTEQHLANTEAWLQSRRATLTDRQQLGAIDQIIAEVEQERQMKAAELDDLTADKITRQHQLSAGRMVGGGGGGGARGIKPGSKTAETVATIDGDLDTLRQAEEWVNSLPGSDQERLPGYEKPLGKVVNSVSSFFTGESSEKGNARQNVERVASIVQRPLGKSDSDRQAAMNISVGNGSRAQLKQTLRRERERLLKERAAQTGEQYVPSGRAAVPGAR